MFKALAIRLSEDAAIANCHNAGCNGQVAVGRSLSEACSFKVLFYSMSDRVYLDWNATTPLRREAREAMAAAWDLCGNPSSVHSEGREARWLVAVSRAAIEAANG